VVVAVVMCNGRLSQNSGQVPEMGPQDGWSEETEQVFVFAPSLHGVSECWTDFGSEWRWGGP